MKLKKLYARFFHIVELEDPYQDVVGKKGMKKIVTLSFLIAFVLGNLLTSILFGRADHGFIIPTGLNVNRLMLITLILFIIYNSFNAEKIIDLDRKYGLDIVYLPEKHEEFVIKKHGEINEKNSDYQGETK